MHRRDVCLFYWKPGRKFCSCESLRLLEGNVSAPYRRSAAVAAPGADAAAGSWGDTHTLGRVGSHKDRATFQLYITVKEVGPDLKKKGGRGEKGEGEPGKREFAVKEEKRDLMRLPMDARHPEAKVLWGGSPEGCAQGGEVVKSARIAFPSHPRRPPRRHWPPPKDWRGRDRPRPAPGPPIAAAT